MVKTVTKTQKLFILKMFSYTLKRWNTGGVFEYVFDNVFD